MCHVGRSHNAANVYILHVEPFRGLFQPSSRFHKHVIIGAIYLHWRYALDGGPNLSAML